jgi:hypothetical protein
LQQQQQEQEASVSMMEFVGCLVLTMDVVVVAAAAVFAVFAAITVDVSSFAATLSAVFPFAIPFSVGGNSGGSYSKGAIWFRRYSFWWI